MTAAARETLDDCRGALEELTDGIQGRVWRRRWIICVVLLRAIGHVLEKVDAQRDEKLKASVEAWWKSLTASRTEPAIFWCFIEEERNAILKEYRTRAGQGVTIQLRGMEVSTSGNQTVIDPPLPTIYHYTINSGPFAGRDQRELVREAIAWWDEQLNAIAASARVA